MALSISSAVSLFLCFLSSVIGAVAVPPGRIVTPAWRVDLRPAIGGVPLPFLYSGRYELKGPLVTSLWFTDDDTIVATFVLRGSSEGSPKLSTRNGREAALPLRLHGVFLDATTGKIKANADWPSGSRWSKIVAAHDGEFVIQRGNELTLLSSDLSTLHDAKLPPRNEVDWGALPSPTGMNILFSSLGPDSVSRLWFETDTLQMVHSWEMPLGESTAIADGKVALITCVVNPHCESNVLVRGLSTGWTRIASGHGAQYPQFVNEEMLFLPINPLSHDPIRLVRTDGRVIFSQDQPPTTEGWDWCNYVLACAIVSAHENRLIVAGFRPKGGSVALDIGGYSVLNKILVYDVSFDGRPRIFDVGGPKIKDPDHWALSPDGSKLAVLEGESVEVLQLPPHL
jgi:hypothetical protein